MLYILSERNWITKYITYSQKEHIQNYNPPPPPPEKIKDFHSELQYIQRKTMCHIVSSKWAH